MADDDDRAWHLDKRVPLAFILALLIQTGGFVWYASKLDSRVAEQEHALADVRSRISDVDHIRDGTRDRVTKLETQGEAVRDNLARLERKIDFLIDQMSSAK